MKKISICLVIWCFVVAASTFTPRYQVLMRFQIGSCEKCLSKYLLIANAYQTNKNVDFSLVVHSERAVELRKFSARIPKNIRIIADYEKFEEYFTQSKDIAVLTEGVVVTRFSSGERAYEEKLASVINK